MKRIYLLFAILLFVVVLFLFRVQLRAFLRGEAHSSYTVSARLRQYSTKVQSRLAPAFAQAHVNYPPKHLIFLALKTEKELQVFAGDDNMHMRHIRNYPILAASGELGPKQLEGDMQVPEGIYRIDSLNPNSSYHLALHINYPNAFDHKMAKLEDRKKLGGDIMIHGNSVSAGCLAVGDQAAEDLFVMTAKVGIKNVEVILAPLDFRTKRLPIEVVNKLPKWHKELYAQISERLAQLPKL